MTDIETARTPCDTLITAGWIITVDRDRRIITDGAIAVTGSEIVAIDKASVLEALYEPASRIDRPDGVVLPGMVNGHRHLLTCAKGAMPEGGSTLEALRRFIYPSFAALGPEEMHLYALHSTAEMIRHGTTLFEEPGCNHLDAVLEALDTSGIRCRVGPWTWDQQGSAGDDGLPDWLRLSTKQCIRRLEDGIRQVREFDNPLIRDAVTIEGVGTCSDELTVAAAKIAEEADSLAVQHKATSEREVELELASFGHRPIEHCAHIGALNPNVLLNHVTSVDSFEVDLIAQNGARISQNPSSALKLAKGTTQFGKWPELLRAEVPMGLGTDAENVSNHQDICRSIFLAALLPRDARQDPNAVSAEQAVEMGTLGGARALRWDDVTGCIEAGNQADIVIFDTNDYDWRPLHNPVANLAYGVTGHSVDTVLIAGRTVLANKKSTIVDEDEIRDQVERTNRRILSSIGIDPTPMWPVT